MSTKAANTHGAVWFLEFGHRAAQPVGDESDIDLFEAASGLSDLPRFHQGTPEVDTTVGTLLREFQRIRTRS